MLNLLRRSVLKGAAAAAALTIGLTALPHAASAETELRVVPHSGLKILDPIWTTAYITRNHGYMIYDTLFAMDPDGNVQPQMVDSVSRSDDGKTVTITLRDGLKWHDGAAVTATDTVASINRWASKDAMGQKMMTFVDSLEATDDKTMVFTLNAPTGLIELALAKPSSNVPFMMPARIAATPGDEQIAEYIGSGPFSFNNEEWEPGVKVVYEKFDDYVPRSEATNGFAGAKIAKVDRVIWTPNRDIQQAINALNAGEVVALVAPSGSGKSTLLHIAGLLDEADEGRVSLAGTEMAGQSDRRRTAARREDVGFVYQFHHLLPEFTALENITLPQFANGVSPKAAEARAMELLSSVDVAHRASHRPAELSGGEQQRVAFCRALANAPRVLLADEPTGNLHSEQGKEIMELFKKLNDEGTTIVQVTHSHENAEYSHRVVELKDGWVVGERKTAAAA